MGYILKLGYVALVARGLTKHHETNVLIKKHHGQMNYNKFVKYYSYSRVFKYYKAAHGSKTKTMMLYYGNLKIAGAFHSLLGTAEVILRNSLHRELTKLFNDGGWITNQKSGFMISPLLTRENKKSGSLKTNDYLLHEVSKAEKKLKEKGVHITSGSIIAEQTFGFWISFFDLIHYKILKGVPIKVFKKLPVGYGRKEIYETLDAIRKFRNRINHNEPICFVNGQMDFSYVRNTYQIIIKTLSWIDPEIIPSLYEIDKVLKVIDKEERKQLN